MQSEEEISASNYTPLMQSPKKKKEEVKFNSQKAEVEQLPPLSERQKGIVIALSGVILAFIWKYYLDNPGEAILYLSIGLSIIQINIALFFIKIWRARTKATLNNGEITAKSKEKTFSQIVNKQVVEKQDIPKVELENNSINFPQTPEQQFSNKEKNNLLCDSCGKAQSHEASQFCVYCGCQIQESLNPLEGYYQNISDNTSLLQDEENTHLLIEPIDTVPEKNNYYLFIKSEEGEKIYLVKDKFYIGRHEECDYIDTSKNISRKHILLIKTEDDWHVKDLNSTNASYLNEQKLIPEKLYPLQNDDCIRIAKVEFIFKVESI